MCPEYAVGPGHHSHNRNVVLETYVDTGVLEFACPNCGVKAGDFCIHNNGVARKCPCPRRISAAAQAVGVQEEQPQ